jgi:hypothetical protein
LTGLGVPERLGLRFVLDCELAYDAVGGHRFGYAPAETGGGPVWERRGACGPASAAVTCRARTGASDGP